MEPHKKISEFVLLKMQNFLYNEKFVGRIAGEKDLFFITDGSWLKDTAVFDAVLNRFGAWDVDLIFVHYRNPLQFIVRHITRCYSENKARAAAFYLRKEAAKDQRGTLKVSIADLNLCYN